MSRSRHSSYRGRSDSYRRGGDEPPADNGNPDTKPKEAIEAPDLDKKYGDEPLANGDNAEPAANPEKVAENNE